MPQIQSAGEQERSKGGAEKAHSRQLGRWCLWSKPVNLGTWAGDSSRARPHRYDSDGTCLCRARACAWHSGKLHSSLSRKRFQTWAHFRSDPFGSLNYIRYWIDFIPMIIVPPILGRLALSGQSDRPCGLKSAAIIYARCQGVRVEGAAVCIRGTAVGPRTIAQQPTRASHRTCHGLISRA